VPSRSFIQVYRGGYSPVERREIEAGLFSGSLLGVAATNALELGVDVGSLDVTLHLGFQVLLSNGRRACSWPLLTPTTTLSSTPPQGSIASMRQQSGRAGRREQPSMAIYVAFDGPMDQHFMMHPEDLLGKPIESAQVDALTLFQSHFSIEYILPFST